MKVAIVCGTIPSTTFIENLIHGLASNGVKVKLICQQKTDGSWYNDNTEYSKEEKDLTLKILETAIQIKVEDQL